MKKVFCFLFLVLLIVSFSSQVSAASSSVVGLESNTSYYIMNIPCKKYINIYSASSSASTGVLCRDRNTMVDLAKWTFSFDSNGNVQLIDSSGRALTISSSNGVYAYTNTGDSTQQFRITRITSTGTYQGTYLIKYGNLYLTSSTTGSLSLSSSITDNARWSIFQSEKGTSVLYDYNVEDDIDTTLSADEYNTAMASRGYTHSELTNRSASTIYNKMKTDTDIMCISTHGLSDDGIALAAISANTGSSESYIFAHSSVAQLYTSSYYAINNLSTNEMSSYRCVFLSGCGTGLSFVHNGVSYNLPQAIVSTGAHCAIGTTRDTQILEIALFYYYMRLCNTLDYNISEMMSYIDGRIKATHGESYGFPYVIYGDRHQYLNFNS